MRQEIFKKVLDDIRKGNVSDIIIEEKEQTYTRRWVPKERLILLGGGHISKKLCTIANMLDFEVTVVDDRAEFADRSRFPEAAHVICGNFPEVIRNLSVGIGDYICVITRGHCSDWDCVEALLKEAEPTYMGMIGSKRRVRTMMQQLRDAGHDPERLDKICTPIGLDICAQTVAEIAVAIIAQLIQYRRDEKYSSIQHACMTHIDVDEKVLETLANGNGTQVMAIILKTQGSTPAKSGAIMSIDGKGQITGTIGGGLGEGTVIACGKAMVGTMKRKILEIDMSNEVAANQDMVCGGRMTVLLETIDEK